MTRHRNHPKWWLLIMVLLVGWLGLTTVASADNADVKDSANILSMSMSKLTVKSLDSKVLTSDNRLTGMNAKWFQVFFLSIIK